MVDRQVPGRNGAPKETQEDAPSNSRNLGAPWLFLCESPAGPQGLGEFQSDVMKDCPPGFHLCRTRGPLGTGLWATLPWVSKVWPEQEAPNRSPVPGGCSIPSAPPLPSPQPRTRAPPRERTTPTCGHQLLYLAVVTHDDEGLLCLSQAGWEEQDLGRKGCRPCPHRAPQTSVGDR